MRSSKYIPVTKNVHEPRHQYMANPKTGEVVKVRTHRKDTYQKLVKLSKQGYAVTSKDIYERYVRAGEPIPKSFTPTEYPSSSGNYVYSSVFFHGPKQGKETVNQ